MSSRSRLVLDLGMFLAMLVAFNPAFTGIAVHEWLSVAVVVPLLFHTIINWEWTLHTIDTVTQKLLSASRLNLVVDIALFVSTVAVMLSGLLISQAISGALGLLVAPSTMWVAVHAVSADATVLLLFTHLALHGRWIARTVRSYGRAPRPHAIPTAARR